MRILYNILHPCEWRIIQWINEIRFKIKDYDRLEYDYSCVLQHATSGKMSKTNYELDTIYTIINDAQHEVSCDIFNDIVDHGGDIEELRNYFRKQRT